MNKYYTTDDELKQVADAIRYAGEFSAALVYPWGFISAISALYFDPREYIFMDCSLLTTARRSIILIY